MRRRPRRGARRRRATSSRCCSAASTALERMVGGGARDRRGAAAPTPSCSARCAARRAAAAPRRREKSRPNRSAAGGRSGGAPRPARRAAPPPSVRVHTETLDRFLSTVGEVILNTRQVRTVGRGRARPGHAELADGLDRMDRVVGELQRRALELRTTPLLRVARAAAARGARGRRAAPASASRCELRGAELELDRSILDRLADPLVHLVRNAVDHGIEPPEERARRGQADGRAHRDRGAPREGHDPHLGRATTAPASTSRRCARRAVEAGVAAPRPRGRPRRPSRSRRWCSSPGLSTRGEVSEISGRGVGMDAVRSTLESLGGTSSSRIAARARHDDHAASCRSRPRCSACCCSGSAPRPVAMPIAKVERIVECPTERIERAGRRGVRADRRRARCRCSTSPRGSRSRAPPPGRVTHLVLTEVRGERVALSVERARRPAGDLREAGAASCCAAARALVGPHDSRRRASDLPARPEPDRMSAAARRHRRGRDRSAARARPHRRGPRRRARSRGSRAARCRMRVPTVRLRTGAASGFVRTRGERDRPGSSSSVAGRPRRRARAAVPARRRATRCVRAAVPATRRAPQEVDASALSRVRQHPGLAHRLGDRRHARRRAILPVDARARAARTRATALARACRRAHRPPAAALHRDASSSTARASSAACSCTCSIPRARRESQPRSAPRRRR